MLDTIERMNLLRIVAIMLAAIQTVVAIFLMLVGNFADGGQWWERLILTLLHPLGAAALIILAARPQLSRGILAPLSALLALNVAADVFIAVAILTGITRGDFVLPLMIGAIPALGLLYSLYLLRRT